MDFTAEELFDAIDRVVRDLLSQAGADEPPVDAIAVAQEPLAINVTWDEGDDVDERGRPVPRARRRASDGIVLTPTMTDEQQHAAAAQAVARVLLPDVLRKVGMVPGTESKQGATQVRGFIAARFLLPTKMFAKDARAFGYDLPALKERYATASWEAIALRFVDLEDPCVVAVIDDGVVHLRRANTFPATRKLTAAEQACFDRVAHLDAPERVRQDGWTVHGWPIPDRPFRRVVLRAVPDDV